MTYPVSRSQTQSTEPSNADQVVIIPSSSGGPTSRSYQNFKADMRRGLGPSFTPSATNLYAAILNLLNAGSNVSITGDGSDDITIQASITASDGGATFTPSATNLYDAVIGLLNQGTNITVVGDGTDDITVNATITQASIYTSVKAILESGNNVTLTDDDDANTITVASTASGGIQRSRQDTVDLLVGDTGGDINFTRDGSGGSSDLRGSIRAGTIDTAELAGSAVETAKINNNAVTTAKINNSAVTENKIGLGAVTENKIGVGAVTVQKLGASSVATSKINNLAVTGAKIAAATISAAKLDAALTTVIGRIPTDPGNNDNSKVWKTSSSGVPGWRDDASGGTGGTSPATYVDDVTLAGTILTISKEGTSNPDDTTITLPSGTAFAPSATNLYSAVLNLLTAGTNVTVTGDGTDDITVTASSVRSRQDTIDLLIGDTGGSVDFTRDGSGSTSNLRATLRANGVVAASIATNAVTSAKINNGAVSQTKLAAAVQTILGRVPSVPPNAAGGQNKVWKTDTNRVPGWRDDTGGGGAESVDPEIFELNNISIPNDSIINTAASIKTSATTVDTLITAVNNSGITIRAGSYALTFTADLDPDSWRFTPQIVMLDGTTEIGVFSGVYLRGDHNVASDNIQKVRFAANFYLSSDTAVTFAGRHLEVDANQDTGNGGDIENINGLLQPVGGVKGDIGPAGTGPEPATYVDEVTLAGTTLTISREGTSNPSDQTIMLPGGGAGINFTYLIPSSTERASAYSAALNLKTFNILADLARLIEDTTRATNFPASPSNGDFIGWLQTSTNNVVVVHIHQYLDGTWIEIINRAQALNASGFSATGLRSAPDSTDEDSDIEFSRMVRATKSGLVWPHQGSNFSPSSGQIDYVTLDELLFLGITPQVGDTIMIEGSITGTPAPDTYEVIVFDHNNDSSVSTASSFVNGFAVVELQGVSTNTYDIKIEGTGTDGETYRIDIDAVTLIRDTNDIVAQIAASYIRPDIDLMWSAIHHGIQPWETGRFYRVDAIVIDNGELWRATSAHGSAIRPSSTSSTNWTRVTTGGDPATTFSPTVLYNGDLTFQVTGSHERYVSINFTTEDEWDDFDAIHISGSIREDPLLQSTIFKEDFERLAESSANINWYAGSTVSAIFIVDQGGQGFAVGRSSDKGQLLFASTNSSSAGETHTLMIRGINFGGLKGDKGDPGDTSGGIEEWSSGTYEVGDIVHDSGLIYECTQETSSLQSVSPTQSTTRWSLLGAWQGNWSSRRYYGPGSIVRDNNFVWFCIQFTGSAGTNRPAANSSYWINLSAAGGAEQNVQSDWNETDSASDAFIQNKPSLPGVGLATSSSDGLLSSAYFNKLRGIASGAEQNVQPNWTESATNSDAFIRNKPNALSFNNRGQYVSATTYNPGDIVYYGSEVLVCDTTHASVALLNYNNFTSLFSLTMFLDYDGRIRASLRGGILSEGFGGFIIEDGSGNDTAIVHMHNRHAWSGTVGDSNSIYYTENVVKHNGSRYVCLVQHTSNTSVTEPGVGSSWQTYWEAW